MPLHSRAVQASPVAIIICDEVIAYRSLHCRKPTRFQLLIRCGGSFFCFAHVSQYAWGNLLTANSKITLKMQINPVRTNLPNFIGLCFFILNSLFMIWTLRSHSLVLSSFRNAASRSIVFAFVFVHTNVMWLWMYAKWHRPNWRERKIARFELFTLISCVWISCLCDSRWYRDSSWHHSDEFDSCFSIQFRRSLSRGARMWVCLQVHTRARDQSDTLAV